MNEQRMKTALTGLQWTLGIVILIEAILFVMPSAGHGFAQTHMPDALRFVLGGGEIIGCVLLLIPRTAVRGAWILTAVFGLAILIHLLHGMYNVSDLLIYLAAAWTLAVANEC
jgi:DoxX-like protein